MLKPLLTASLLALSLPHAGSAQTHAPIIETPPEPGIVQGCGHYAIIAAARSLDGAFSFQNHLGAVGSGVLDNDSVAQFRDGFHSVVFGPYGTRSLASRKVAEWRDRAPDAYVKYGCVQGTEARSVQDTTTAPLPLAAGVYVLEDVGCDQPPNAAFRLYDGDGISGSATRSCRFEVESRDGALYGGTNSCENTYDGSRTATEISVRVLGPESFRLAENGTVEGDYRYCPSLDPGTFDAERG